MSTPIHTIIHSFIPRILRRAVRAARRHQAQEAGRPARVRLHSAATGAVRRAVRRLGPLCTVLLIPAVVIATPGSAHAARGSGAAAVLAVNTLPHVIASLQAWLMGILAGVATLFLVLAGVYWATAGGDPATVERAKSALKNALIGYGLAVLAPILLAVVKGIVGG